jgi:hypothetical protein
MDSEGLQLKERLAVERRAQPQLKSIAGDSTTAAWAHLRQRLARAEREARTTRRVAVALCCMALTGAAAVLAVERPWSAAVGSSRGAGDFSLAAKSAQGSLALAGPSTGPPVPHLNATLPSPTPSGDGLKSREPERGTRPGLVSPGETATASVRKSAGKVDAPAASGSHGELCPITHQAASGTRPRGLGVGGPAIIRMLPQGPVSRPASGPRCALHRQSGRSRSIHGSARWAQASGGWRRRTGWGDRQTFRFRRRSRFWRIVRVFRRRSTGYCLVDSHGNRWEARRVRSWGVRGRGRGR